jgi:hypothetical protein
VFLTARIHETAIVANGGVYALPFNRDAKFAARTSSWIVKHIISPETVSK